jgi:uncharacterized delta-60 repeat protein
LADGAIDTSFNGSGYRFANSNGQDGISLDPVVDRVPTVRVGTVVQSDGKIVIGGRAADNFMTLVRYNVDGSLDSSFGTGGFVRRQFPVTPGTTANPPALGPSGAVAITQDASGNVFVAGNGGGASEFVAEFSAAGDYVSSAVCYAPQYVAYTPRAIVLRPDGSIVIAGAARDRRVDPDGVHARTMYGQRAVVRLPASGNSTTGCGTRAPLLGSDGVTIDGLGHDGSVSDGALSGRWYDGVVALPDNRYVVVSTNGPEGAGTASWVQRYTPSGAPDTTFNGTGRVPIADAGLHAAVLLGDGSLLAAGEIGGQMLLARVADSGVVSGLSTSHAAAGGGTGQALAVQPDGRVIVGGGALVGRRLALTLVRFTTDGAIDGTFGNAGQITTLVGTHDSYITALALNGSTVVAAGRGRTTAAPGMLLSIAARYHAVGGPAPAPDVTPPLTVVTAPAVSPVGVGTKTTTITVAKTVKLRACLVPKVTGRKLKRARQIVLARGCRTKIRYLVSKKAKNIVLAQSRKAGKKLRFRTIIKLTIAKKAVAKAKKS